MSRYSSNSPGVRGHGALQARMKRLSLAPVLVAVVALAAKTSAQSAPALNAAGAPEDRVVFIATSLSDAAQQYVDQLGPRVMRIRLIANTHIDPDHDLKINFDRVDAALANWFAPGYNGVICLDWEAEFFDALREGPTHINFQKALNKGVALINYVKTKRPNAKVGYYGMPTAHWNTDFQTLAPLFNAMDVLFPSAYLADTMTYEENVVKLHSNVTLALQIANGKPVVVFQSPRWAGRGGDRADEIVDRDEFISIVRESFEIEVSGRRAAGVAIWDMTMLWHNKDQLSAVDSEYIPAGMDCAEYVTQFQRYFICSTVEAVMPEIICGQPFPGSEFVVQETNSDGTPDSYVPPDDVPADSGVVITTDPSEDSTVDSPSFADGESDEPAAEPVHGTNISPLNPHIAGWTFANQLWTSSPWQIIRADGTLVTGDAGEFGYPMPAAGEFAQTVIGANMKNHLPPGKWLCLYEGEGQFQLSGDVTLLNESPGSKLVRVTPTAAGVTLRLSNVSTGNPLRNMRVVPLSAVSGSVAQSLLHPQFVLRMQAEQPEVLRFASWQKVDGSRLKLWSDRITREHASQITEDGIAIELMNKVCNQLDCDAWYSVPVKADDEFVRKFAQMAMNGLDEGQRVMVEYASNHVLDPSNPQFNYAVNKGAELVPGGSDLEAAVAHYAKRSQEVMAIWRQQFGEQAHRVVGVLSVPADQDETASLVLEHTDAVASADMLAMTDSISAAAIAHVLSLSTVVTVDGTVSLLQNQHNQRMASFSAVADLVKSTGKPFVVAGAGSGLLVSADGFAKSVIKTLRKVETDPRVLAINGEEQEFWAAAGAEMILVDDTPGGP